MTGSDPYSKSLPCSCVTDAALPGRIHIWVFLGLPRCPALKSHLRLGSSPRSGGPWTALLSLLSCGHRPWHGRAARWAGQEVAGCDWPDNRAEVSKVGRYSEEGPRLELGGLFYPSPITTLCGFSASLGLLLCRKLPQGLFQGLDESAFEVPSTTLHRWDARWLLPHHRRAPLGPPGPGCTWPSQELGF